MVAKHSTGSSSAWHGAEVPAAPAHASSGEENHWSVHGTVVEELPHMSTSRNMPKPWRGHWQERDPGTHPGHPGRYVGILDNSWLQDFFEMFTFFFVSGGGLLKRNEKTKPHKHVSFEPFLPLKSLPRRSGLSFRALLTRQTKLVLARGYIDFWRTSVGRSTCLCPVYNAGLPLLGSTHHGDGTSTTFGAHFCSPSAPSPST